MYGRWREAWARAGWRVWDLGNGTITLQKLFNPEWQITSKSFLLSPFVIDFSFSPSAEISRLELEFEERLPRKTASIFKEGIGQESNGAANQEKQIFLPCQISPSASSTRDLGTRLKTTPSTPFCFRSGNMASQQTSGYWQRSRKRTVFWLTSAMHKCKTRFKLVKSWGFFLIYSSLAVDGGEIKESCVCEQRSSRLSLRRKSKEPLSRRVENLTTLIIFDHEFSISGPH